MESQFAAILSEFEKEVQVIITTMTAGVTTSSGDLEEESQSEDGSRIIHEILEEDNKRLGVEVGRCHDEIHKLQQENAEQRLQMGLLKNKMLEHAKISIDNLKASENSKRELLRGELESAQRRILELEGEREVARRNGEVKVAELEGKDNLVADLLSLVESLERSYEKKSREVDQLTEELAREKLAGQRALKELERKIHYIYLANANELTNQLLTMVDGVLDNPAMANSDPDPTTPPVGEALSSGGSRGTHVKEIEWPIATGMETVDDNELVGASSVAPSSSSDSPFRDFNLRKRNIDYEQVACVPSGSDSSSTPAKPICQISSKKIKTDTSSSQASASLQHQQQQQTESMVDKFTPGGNHGGLG